MTHHIAVQLPADLFHAMFDATGEQWFGIASEAALCDAVVVAFPRGAAVAARRQLQAGLMAAG